MAVWSVRVVLQVSRLRSDVKALERESVEAFQDLRNLEQQLRAAKKEQGEESGPTQATRGS